MHSLLPQWDDVAEWCAEVYLREEVEVFGRATFGLDDVKRVSRQQLAFVKNERRERDVVQVSNVGRHAVVWTSVTADEEGDCVFDVMPGAAFSMANNERVSLTDQNEFQLLLLVERVIVKRERDEEKKNNNNDDDDNDMIEVKKEEPDSSDDDDVKQEEQEEESEEQVDAQQQQRATSTTTNEVPMGWKCPYCVLCSKTTQHVRSHVATMHKNYAMPATFERAALSTLACTTCDKRLYSKEALKKHEKVCAIT